MLSTYKYMGYIVRLVQRHEYSSIDVYLDNDIIYNAIYYHKFAEDSAFRLYRDVMIFITRRDYDSKYSTLIERKLI